MLKGADGEETWKIHTTGLINNQVSSELKYDNIDQQKWYKLLQKLK